MNQPSSQSTSTSDGASEPRRPKVMVLTHSLSAVDGVGVYCTNTLRFLAPLCDGISVYMGRKHRGIGAELPMSGVTVYEILPTDHFPFLSLPKLAWLLLTSLPMLVRAARRADVVHSFSDYPMGFVATLVGLLARRPVVVSGHGTYSVAPCAMPFHKRLISWMYSRADRFVMGANFALRQVRLVADPAAAEVVPYGCVPDDYSEFATGGTAAEAPEPFVLCVGEVKQRKGYTTSLPAFLEAWKQRPEMHFVIVGRYVEDDPYYRQLLEWIASAGAADAVHFVGNVSEQRKVALMRDARVFMLTPMTSAEGGFEAFGLVFLEAGAANTPVVGVTDSGAEDAITHGMNGFLHSRNDLEGLSQSLVRLFAEERLANEMGAAGRVRAEGQTWAKAAARVGEIYGEVLGGSPRSSQGNAP
ncbi:MAG: glycosyltransferase involved in cell wall biosynthesis [Pseudohongiellaceae bacterium]|jgi:glycosyltransferase involved in cell wall biosynthesis